MQTRSARLHMMPLRQSNRLCLGVKSLMWLLWYSSIPDQKTGKETCRGKEGLALLSLSSRN